VKINDKHMKYSKTDVTEVKVTSPGVTRFSKVILYTRIIFVYENEKLKGMVVVTIKVRVIQ